MNKTIVAEVVESHGCNSQHRVGDKLNPKRICIYALSTVAPLIFTTIELFYAGADPNEMRFNRTGCFDVGVRCDGWGRIVMEVRLEDRK
jgi:hypothetical protein